MKTPTTIRNPESIVRANQSAIPKIIIMRIISVMFNIVPDKQDKSERFEHRREYVQ